MNVLDRIERGEMELAFKKHFEQHQIRRSFAPTYTAEVLRIARIGQQMRWVPVSERLPEEDGRYIVFTKDKRIVTALYTGKCTYPWTEYDVVAWIPLPEPPEGVKHDGNQHDVHE